MSKNINQLLRMMYKIRCCVARQCWRRRERWWRLLQMTEDVRNEAAQASIAHINEKRFIVRR